MKYTNHVVEAFQYRAEDSAPAPQWLNEAIAADLIRAVTPDFRIEDETVKAVVSTPDGDKHVRDTDWIIQDGLALRVYSDAEFTTSFVLVA